MARMAALPVTVCFFVVLIGQFPVLNLDDVKFPVLSMQGWTASAEVETFYRGVGCKKCRDSGYSGRLGIYELLVPDDALRDHITASPSINELRELAAAGGMIRLRADGMAKVKAGITTVEEVMRVTAAT